MTKAQEAPQGTPTDVVGVSEAAQICGVVDRTIVRWAESGLLSVAYRTAGGHRRFARDTVLDLAHPARTR